MSLTVTEIQKAAIAAIPTDVLINGYQTVKARWLDGTTEEVKVKLVPVTKVAKYLDIIGDPGRYVEFMCGKPADWADRLHPDSFEEIDTLARSLNDPFVDRFLTRQKSILQKLAPMKNLAASMS